MKGGWISWNSLHRLPVGVISNTYFSKNVSDDQLLCLLDEKRYPKERLQLVYMMHSGILSKSNLELLQITYTRVFLMSFSPQNCVPNRTLVKLATQKVKLDITTEEMGSCC